MFSPIVSACCACPVSPLAWLLLGLLLFKVMNPAIWAIFICSIWPMIINTAVGVSRVPQGLPERGAGAEPVRMEADHESCCPPLPYVLTGVRLSIGTAWLVIVAAEMLTGGTGITGCGMNT